MKIHPRQTLLTFACLLIPGLLLALVLLLPAAAPPLPAAETPAAALVLPTHAVYKAKASGVPIAIKREDSQSMTADDSWQLESISKALGNKATESSSIVLDDPAAPELLPEVRPVTYKYRRGKKRSTRADFDWEAGSVRVNRNGKTWEEPLPENAEDNLSYLVQLRHDLHNHLAAGGEIEDFEKTYMVFRRKDFREWTFQAEAEESIETAAGKLETIRLVRHKDDGKVSLWLAKDWQFLLVQLIQEGDEKGKVSLREAKVGDSEVSGL